MVPQENEAAADAANLAAAIESIRKELAFHLPLMTELQGQQVFPQVANKAILTYTRVNQMVSDIENNRYTRRDFMENKQLQDWMKNLHASMLNDAAEIQSAAAALSQYGPGDYFMERLDKTCKLAYAMVGIVHDLSQQVGVVLM